MNITIHKDWNYPNIFRQTPGDKGEWGDCSFSESCFFNSDLHLVLNRPARFLAGFVPRGRKWLYMQEPPVESWRSVLGSYKYFDRVYSFWPKGTHQRQYHGNTCLPWHVDKSYDELINLNYAELAKKDEICWITSNKASFAGQRLRLEFLEYLQNVNFDFSLFGKGFTPVDDKFSVLGTCKYSFAIENYNTPHYWTEKISDCFLSWCMPIYWGDPLIKDYFPERSMICINPAKPEEALTIIKKALDKDLWSKNLDAIAEARELILNKYQLFPNIVRQLKETHAEHKKYFCFMPPNLSINKTRLISYANRKIKGIAGK